MLAYSTFLVNMNCIKHKKPLKLEDQREEFLPLSSEPAVYKILKEINIQIIKKKRTTQARDLFSHKICSS